MKTRNRALLIGALTMFAPLGACATIIEGSDQPLGLVTTPAGAACDLAREGKVIAQIAPTPGQVVVTKSKHDIHITCRMDGYHPQEVIAKSSFTGTTFGNILAGGLIGVAVDAASGANNEYPESINVTLTPLQRPVAPPQPAAGTPTS